jgi:outer membrane immunogenic protein
MKKIGLAFAAVAAFTGSAVAADIAPRAYSKAPAPMISAPSWTGFYLFGGAGGGLWSADSNVQSIPGGSALTRDKRFGGSGWFGTAGVGFDWQLGNWVTGVFGDGQFGDIRGSLQDDLHGFPALEGRETLRTSWAAGVRLGYLVAPNVLSYVNAGYSGSEWSGTNLTAGGAGGTTVFATTPSFHRNGWFVGGGAENSLNIFGIAAPGWFMKTEYRAAYYDRATLNETFLPFFSVLTPNAVTFKPMVQTISTSLVYRFNWGGAPVGARY